MASDWSIVIISTPPPSLTRRWGECLRVVGIHSDGGKDREISLDCSPFQNYAWTIDQTLLEAIIYHPEHAHAVGRVNFHGGSSFT